MKTVRVRLIGKFKASVASRLSRAVASRGFGNQKNTCYLQLTREQWIMSPIKKHTPSFKVDGIAYFPLFAGTDAKFAKIKALPLIETLVNRKTTEQKDKPLFKKVMMFLKRDHDFRNAAIELLN